MTPELFGRVVLTRDLPEANAQRGDIATVVEIYRDGAGHIAGYELEFFSAAGDTTAVTSVMVDAVRVPMSSDHLAARVA